MAKSNNPTYANKKVRVSDQKFAEDYYKDGKRKGQELGKPKRKWILKACNHIQDLPGVVVGYGDPEYKALECVMTDEEAKAFIANECGFDPEKVVILHEVSTYEVNKYRQLRPAARFTRQPIYNATDWNYIRFDCACFMYELVNGELHFYSC